MYGLPASGKTTLAMELFEKYKKEFDSQSSYNGEKVTYCNCGELNTRLKTEYLLAFTSKIFCFNIQI